MFKYNDKTGKLEVKDVEALRRKILSCSDEKENERIAQLLQQKKIQAKT